jgi:AraC-like DNA-binding protein
MDAQERRCVCYDRDLQLEAYSLQGVVQKFPRHFHAYYVIGFIEDGQRHLWCNNCAFDLGAGTLLLFNPEDSHWCAPIEGSALDYRAINIRPEIMEQAALEITGREYRPCFTQNVVEKSGIMQSLRDLYTAVVHQRPRFEKQELFFFLLEQLLQEYSLPFGETDPVEADSELRNLCVYMQENFAGDISLDDLAAMTSFGKSYLLRSFTKQMGISPYRYLQTVRIGKAKELLEQGCAPIETAMRTGFSDQSHFSNTFKTFIGLTPKQYQKIFIPASSVDAARGGRK